MKRFLFIALLFISFGAFAQTETPTFSAANIIALLTPFIVLGATALVKKITNIGGTTVLIVVTVLSGLTAWITSLAANTDLSFLAQFGYGLIAVFIHQLYSQLTQNK